MAYSVYANNFSPVNPAALALFKSVDTDRSGKVDFRELHRALTHGGSQPFSIKTSRLLMRMFDVSGDGQLGYREFETLIQQVQSWRHWFDQADRDRSDTLSSHELANALAAFGYHLPAQTTDRVFSAVDANSSGSISFDEFVQSLTEVASLTAAFRRYDPTGAGRATLDYGTFMHLVFATRS